MTPLPAPLDQSCPKAATSGEGLPRRRHSATIGRVSRPQLAVHGHFYQPERRDPFSGEIAPQPAAAPYRDWNARIDAECYKPNAERGNLRHISYDLGPTLASWLKTNDAATHQGFVDSDAPLGVDDRDRGNAMAQSYHHAILPLASMADRRTEIRWGLRDFDLRFGRRPTGIWLPETAVDLPTLRILADEKVKYTILAPWQAADSRLDTGRPYRVDLGGRRSIVVFFYDAALSASASFESDATMNADAFARDRILPRFSGPGFADGTPVTALIATDGELYGHHQKFRDLFLARLGADLVELPPRRAALDGRMPGRRRRSLEGAAPRGFRAARFVDRRRGGGPCGRLYGTRGVVAGTRRVRGRDLRRGDSRRIRAPPAAPRDARAARGFPGSARSGALAACDVRQRRLVLGRPGSPGDQARHVVRGKAARLVDAAAGTDLERRLVDDLSLLSSPSRRIDGAAIYAEALTAAGQPVR